MGEAVRILEQGRTPAEWLADLSARGIHVSERTVRAKARAMEARNG